LAVDELARRYRAAKGPHERSWWQILWLLARGQTAIQIAESTGYSAYWIGQVAKRYNVGGPAAMVNRQHTHSRRTPPLLTPTQQEELRQALLGPAPQGPVDGASGGGMDERAIGATRRAAAGLDLPHSTPAESAGSPAAPHRGQPA
jgi:hypothetical protein